MTRYITLPTVYARLSHVAFSGDYHPICQVSALGALVALTAGLGLLILPAMIALAVIGMVTAAAVYLAVPVALVYSILTDRARQESRLAGERQDRLDAWVERIRAEARTWEPVVNVADEESAYQEKLERMFDPSWDVEIEGIVDDEPMSIPVRTTSADELVLWNPTMHPTCEGLEQFPTQIVPAVPASEVLITTAANAPATLESAPVKVKAPRKPRKAKSVPQASAPAWEGMNQEALATWLRANGCKTARKNWSLTRLQDEARKISQ